MGIALDAGSVSLASDSSRYNRQLRESAERPGPLSVGRLERWTICKNCCFFKVEGEMCMGMMDAQCQLVVGSTSPMGGCDLFAPLPQAD
jgi:hypothetical protein